MDRPYTPLQFRDSSFLTPPSSSQMFKFGGAELSVSPSAPPTPFSSVGCRGLSNPVSFTFQTPATLTPDASPSQIEPSFANDPISYRWIPPSPSASAHVKNTSQEISQTPLGGETSLVLYKAERGLSGSSSPDTNSHALVRYTSGTSAEPEPIQGLIPTFERYLSLSTSSMRQSQASFASDDGMQLVPYDAHQEPVPDLPFFATRYQNSLQDGRRIAADAALMLSSSDVEETTDAGLGKLRHSAEMLASFKGTKTRTVAVLGNSGEGKSSLINALLDMPNIARTSDSGAACTSVVTEYRYAKSDQVSPIALEAEYLTFDEMSDLITELLWEYRRSHHPDNSSPNTLTDEESAKIFREGQRAFDALRSAFGHNKDFTADFLQDTSSGATEKIKAKLIAWARDLKWPESEQDGLWSSTAADAKDCRKKVDKFMSKSLWPFTKIVRIYLDARVLMDGVVLTDLPGLHDTNLARVRTTQNYLLNCDLFLVVTNIARAITDLSLQTILRGALARHMYREVEDERPLTSPLAVVCTKTDNINCDTAIEEFCGPGKYISEEEMFHLTTEIERAERAGDKAHKKIFKRRQKSLLMKARNKHVIEGLQRAYAGTMNSEHLDVFCVTSNWYEKFGKKGISDDVKTSGIPALRQFCRSITAQARLEESNNYLRTKLAGLLNSISLLADSAEGTTSASESVNSDQLIRDVKLVGHTIGRSIEDARKGHRSEFEQHLSKSLEYREQHWTSAATAKHDEWARWHWTQYNAWCLNDGCHETRGRPHRDWNAEIIWRMRMELEDYFNNLDEDVRDRIESVRNDAVAKMEQIGVEITKSSQRTQFSKAIEVQVDELEYRLDEIKQQHQRRVQEFRSHALGSTGNAYILTEMVPSYRMAANEYGNGKAIRQQRHVKGKITSDTPFPNMVIRMCAAAKKVIRKTFTDVQKAMDSAVNNVISEIRAAQMMAQASSLRGHRKPEAVAKLKCQVATLKTRHERLLAEVEGF